MTSDHPLDGLSGGADDENYDNSSSNNNYKSDEERFEEASREFTQQKDLEKDPVTEQDIKFALDVIKKEAPCDETAIKQLWYGMYSGLTKTPLPHNVNSRVAGAGKTYVLILVSEEAWA